MQEQALDAAFSGGALPWAVDMIVHQQLHLLNDRLVAQIVADTYLRAAPHERVADMHAHLLARPVPLVDRRFERCVFYAAPVTFDNLTEDRNGSSIVVYRPVRDGDGITVAFFPKVHIKTLSGPSRVRWPEGLFDL